MKQNW